MENAKRYKPTEAEKYFETYNRKYKHSPILRPQNNLDAGLMFFDRTNITHYITERTGDSTGYYP